MEEIKENQEEVDAPPSRAEPRVYKSQIQVYYCGKLTAAPFALKELLAPLERCEKGKRRMKAAEVMRGLQRQGTRVVVRTEGVKQLGEEKKQEAGR